MSSLLIAIAGAVAEVLGRMGPRTRLVGLAAVLAAAVVVALAVVLSMGSPPNTELVLQDIRVVSRVPGVGVPSVFGNDPVNVTGTLCNNGAATRIRVEWAFLHAVNDSPASTVIQHFENFVPGDGYCWTVEGFPVQQPPGLPGGNYKIRGSVSEIGNPRNIAHAITKEFLRVEP